jgi:hypothetical protein
VIACQPHGIQEYGRDTTAYWIVCNTGTGDDTTSGVEITYGMAEAWTIGASDSCDASEEEQGDAEEITPPPRTASPIERRMRLAERPRGHAWPIITRARLPPEAPIDP